MFSRSENLEIGGIHFRRFEINGGPRGACPVGSTTPPWSAAKGTMSIWRGIPPGGSWTRGQAWISERD